jgi:anti-sigma regulatory factor (Ser/Thr protein kinase)
VQRIDLPSHPASPRQARVFVRDVLTGWGVPEELRENAELLITELVTNAVIHASSDVSVEIRQDGDVVRFGVHDHGPGQIRMRVPAPGDVTGRGLYFLDQLDPDWNVTTSESGDKTIHFSLTGLPSDPGMTA